MTIGITAHFTLPADGSAPFEDAVYHLVSQLVAAHPADQFHIFYSSTEGVAPHLPANTQLHRKPGHRHPLLQKLWYDVSLVRLVKKYKIDVLLSLEGYCSDTKKIPQCLLLEGLSSEGPKSSTRFYHWLLPGFLSRANLIIAGSHRQETFLRPLMKNGDKNLEVVYGGINAAASPLSAEEKAVVQQAYTGGMEYFIYEGPLQTDDVLPVLKAFSLLKKRQRTGWKLVLNGGEAGKEEGLKLLLSTYKYRDDVVCIRLLKSEEQRQLRGAAYGAIDPRTDYYSIQAALAWMARGVPYIAAEGNPVQELDPQAALFFRAEEPPDLAERLMALYKDESLHARLSRQGAELANRFTWKGTADALWDGLVRLHGSRR